MAINKIKVEVAYAKPEKQLIVLVEVEPGSTIETAIRCSGILDFFPEIDLTNQKIGIFSIPRSLSDVVAEGDRIEIYRPLMMDPKEARRKKVKVRRKS